MTTKEELRRLVNRLPAEKQEAARRYLQSLLDDTDEEGEEQLTPDDLAAVQRGLEDFKAGHTVPWEELRQGKEDREKQGQKKRQRQ